MQPLVDYLTAVAAGLQTAATAKGSARWRRLAYVGLYIFVLPNLWWVGTLALALDHIVYPGWKRAPLQQPLFIVGNHRTGSTFLHRLLASDTDQFACFRLVDLVLPGVVQKRLLRLVGRIDAALGGLGERLVDWIDARWATDFREVHPMGLRLPEEDEYVLILRMASAAVWETFPTVARFRRLFWSDSDMDPAELDGLMAFYRSIARRHRYHLGRGTWLSKNPLFSMRITGLRRAFPDARFIFLVRDPRKVVASTANLLFAAVDGVGGLDSDEKMMMRVHEICERMYRETFARLEDLPANRLVVLRQEDLVADLDGTIRMACDQLGLELSPTLQDSIEQAQRRGPSRGRGYTLADFGLTPADVEERYADVMDRWGYA